jgi:LmbE family N-acetylglucosaminyl deacetylase
MRGWPSSKNALPYRRILCLGAHPDDIEIGCGGTLLRWLSENHGIEVSWVVFSGEGDREHEARTSAAQFLRGAKKYDVQVLQFRDSYFPFQGAAIKNYFETLKSRPAPELIFTHYRGDLHQDHRLLSHLTWNTFRDHTILEYEVPKYDGDLGAPNFFVGLSQKHCQRKISLVSRHFRTQRRKRWFSKDLFWSLLRLRGMECQAEQRHAEAFYCRKFYI